MHFCALSCTHADDRSKIAYAVVVDQQGDPSLGIDLSATLIKQLAPDMAVADPVPAVEWEKADCSLVAGKGASAPPPTSQRH